MQVIDDFLSELAADITSRVASDVAERIDLSQLTIRQDAPRVQCPVCSGSGAVPVGFYPLPDQQAMCFISTSAFQVIDDRNRTNESCRACRGRGVV